MFGRNGRDHFAPHSSARFEGYYSRVQLDDGGTIAIIFCWVKGAKERANLVFVTYMPISDTKTWNALLPKFKYEFYPENIDISGSEHTPKESQQFLLTAPGIGTMNVTSDMVEYDIAIPEKQLSLKLRLDNHTPWSSSGPLNGPMGGIAHLSRLLPLNWHVRSTSSIASYTLTYAGVTREGGGLAHIEKNWGASFPRGWIWSQSLTPDAGKTLCLAGGTALPGIHAYLVGYRSPACTWDFRPPFAVAVGRIAPFMRVRHDSVTGTVDLRVQTWTRKLVVKMEAPVDSFVGLPAPLKNGHKPEYAFESFAASTWISAWHRRWPFGKWILVEEGPCGQTAEGAPCAALEFGGSFSHRVKK